MRYSIESIKSKNLFINYSFSTSPFGKIIIASIPQGIAHITFVENERTGIIDLKKEFRGATLRHTSDHFQRSVQMFFKDSSKHSKLKLFVKGTPFQLKVWKALLTIPSGQLSTYGAIAKKIKLPKAHRAVGTAIGKNPIALLIPCHRVIRSDGKLGGYHWGVARKTKILMWEASLQKPLQK